MGPHAKGQKRPLSGWLASFAELHVSRWSYVNLGLPWIPFQLQQGCNTSKDPTLLPKGPENTRLTFWDLYEKWAKKGHPNGQKVGFEQLSLSMPVSLSGRAAGRLPRASAPRPPRWGSWARCSPAAAAPALPDARTREGPMEASLQPM